MTEQQTERPSEEQLAARKKAKAKNPYHSHLGMDYFVFAGSDRPALTMRDEQAADETKCGGVLREKHSFC